MLNAIKQMLSESDGQLSSNRIIYSLCMLIIFIAWGIVSIRNGQLISFQGWDVGLIGVLTGSKVVQKKFEK